MKVLMTNPDFDALGGVTGYVTQLRGRFSVDVVHFVVGKRPAERGAPAMIRRFARDNFRFVSYLRRCAVDVVHVNPSLDWKGVVRDGLLTRLASGRGIPVVVFFHGWRWAIADQIERRYLWLFRALFGKAAGFVVLADSVKEALRQWGFTQPIVKEVTVVSDEVLESFELSPCLEQRGAALKWRVLFLSRIVREKGIYEALDTAGLLAQKHPEVELVVAGDGEELEKAKRYAEHENIYNVKFTGRVRGDEKNRLYQDSHVFFLPSYREGLPGAMVEAMAYGMPVVTRPVGGISDFFVNGRHGFATESLKPEELAGHIERLLLDKALYLDVASYNARYARKHFSASKAAKRLEDFYASCMQMRREEARAR